MAEIKSDHILDAKGMACPMPIVKTKKEIESIEAGKVLLVEATDPGSKADIKAWAERAGHQYLGTNEEGDTLKHYIRKASEEEAEGETSFENVVNNDELKQKLSDGVATVIDVRESAEYAFGHIPGAKSIPLGELDSKIDELNNEDDIYVVCRTGNRSDLAAKKLSEKGYKNVTNVVPGMSEWDGDVEKA
ncbi:rhodanese-related sulfurtransferase/TusA-related sulfurtransferase [Alkalibacillus filiformis]|uniref:Rhodanese-related sulfurtransferase/TusA-related sulfurtransferase n=1 Tax=Alkalibacillus filiformis TaxID=200990 RepID=A0ABU0DVZ5_9BACI|nr:sulfurtransferase TusA family protein [Alkalibacillus filiformis]MDQ0352617.1 rhodanese-related sulfurtransferase/TusA-related sulfurtransferase [Alkalibacillus filiformis]